MVRTLNNITTQARQGSVAAIIQVLNENLAESGVRARAVVAQGVLQLLCEADNPSKLDQAFLVEQLRTTLEAIRPRYIRRVKVNTRIVSEQQLLWLDEIERDPDSQLLWTAEFSLSRPSLKQYVQELWTQWQVDPSQSGAVLADTAQRERQKRRFWQITIGASGLGLFLCLLGWAIYGSLASDGFQSVSIGPQEENTSNSAESSLESSLQAVASNSVSDSAIEGTASSASDAASATVQESESDPDPFVQAVRLAEEAVQDGKTATTVDEWMTLATRWQRASGLMNSVPSDDERYATAQNRTTVYLQNSVDARKRADLARQEQDEAASQSL
ncbi:MAG: hypothetical protein F6K09_09625 [Merismopedia sp. SIO2A8]|nr:hypothetical protein [Symploca sp. SIO2B6]NET48967.1 hypothetical protein [Merismopedia sp. SIO2A8]